MALRATELSNLTWVEETMADKKYSAKEAAVAVLKKASEMFKDSSLAKLSKSDEMGNNPDAKADAQLGEKVEQDVQEHEAQNEDPAHHEKGSYKLAKFMGKMEMKKGSKANEMDKSNGMGQMTGAPSPMQASAGNAAPAAPMVKKESDFDKVKNKIKEKEGYSEKAAAATAAKIGRAELGEAEMARRSAEGRKK